MAQKHRLSLDNILKNTPELAEAASLLANLAQNFTAGNLQQVHTIFFGADGTSRDGDVPTAEDQYRVLVEQIPAVVFLGYLDRGVSEAYVSPHIEKILGFTQQEWLHDPVLWYKQIHDEDKSRWSVDAAGLFLSGDPLKSVYRVLSKDGRIVWFHCEVKMVRRPDGRPWFIHGVGFDITDFKEAEQQLARTYDDLELRVRERTLELQHVNEELARSNAALEQFAYIASHDLQEPLRMVGSFTDLLAKQYRGKLDDDADEFIAYIVDGVQHMQRLILDLLTYSRVGTQPAQFKMVSMESVLDRTVKNLHAAIAESGAQIIRGPLPTVYGDELQLMQLMQNLIGNAIKFRSQRHPRVEIEAAPKGGLWQFSVADNGIGIDQKYAERVFEIFQRLHTRGEYPGTGIGLALCKKIVSRHRGQIWFESKPGQGTTFFCTLPRGN